MRSWEFPKATSLETSQRKQKNAGSISTQEIPIVKLVSDSEVDSEAETPVDFEACYQIQIAWVYSLQTWEETINTSTNRSVTRIRILEDRILHLSELVDLRQFFWLSVTPYAQQKKKKFWCNKFRGWWPITPREYALNLKSNNYKQILSEIWP